MIHRNPNTPRTEAEIDAAATAARKVVETHQQIVEFLRAGRTLAQIDAEIGRILKSLGCRSCFLGYKIPRTPPFPSHACLSLNECVVHGTAGYLTRPLEQGDVLSIDVGVLNRGWIGDAAWTYAIGGASEEARGLMACGRESLRRGIKTLAPENTYIEWAKTVQGYVEGECGYHLVRGLGGHGYGRTLHGPPFVSNTLPMHAGEWPDAFAPCIPGTLVAVEPMISSTTGRTRSAPGTWPVFTADGSLSVHYEADVLITPDGPHDLTDGMQNLPDIVG